MADQVPVEFQEACRAAADSCPTEAISIEEQQLEWGAEEMGRGGIEPPTHGFSVR